MPAGRPSIPYDPRIGAEICERIASSRMGLEYVLDSMRAEPEFEATPTLPTIYKWMEQSEEFFKLSARARLLSADTYADAAVDEAHTHRLGRIVVTRETKEGTFEEEKIIDNVQRSQLIVQALFKRAGQLNPKKYGERQIIAGDPQAPLQIVSSVPRPKK